MSYKDIKNFRHNRKKLLVDCLGGKCAKCGYNTCLSALDFHHIDSNKKDFGVSTKIESLEKCISEIKKCVVLCCRCHRELHDKLWTLDEITIPIFQQSVVDKWITRYIVKLECKAKDCHNIFETSKQTYKKFCSERCRSKHNKQVRVRRRKVKRPTAEKLARELETNTWVGLGCKYGVSDNAVRKWAKSYGLI